MYGKAKGRKGKKRDMSMKKHDMSMHKKKGGKKGSRQAFIDKAEDALGDQPL